MYCVESVFYTCKISKKIEKSYFLGLNAFSLLALKIFSSFEI
jgi:hypothetical protein